MRKHLAQLMSMLTALFLWAGTLSAAPIPALLLPPSTKGPIQVKVGLFYLDFDSLDTTSQNFRASGELYISWKDPRLAFNGASPKASEHVYRKGEIWDPDITVLNATDGELADTNPLHV